MTMEQLLEQMIKKVVTECEDGHRQFIAALNGLAGIHIIEEKWDEAAETYRDVLRRVSSASSISFLLYNVSMPEQ